MCVDCSRSQPFHDTADTYLSLQIFWKHDLDQVLGFSLVSLVGRGTEVRSVEGEREERATALSFASLGEVVCVWLSPNEKKEAKYIRFAAELFTRSLMLA